MKRCPKCNLDYFDNTLEFCLEDGMKLSFLSSYDNEIPTLVKSNLPDETAAKTVNLLNPNIAETLESNFANPNRDIETAPQNNAHLTNPIKEQVSVQSYKILEVAPIFLSLAHNWWQWLYLNNQYYSSVSSFLVSANFLMWLLLLLGGAGVSFFALKKCANKSFAYTGFIILAVNLILFLVPKR